MEDAGWQGETNRLILDTVKEKEPMELEARFSPKPRLNEPNKPEENALVLADPFPQQPCSSCWCFFVPTLTCYNNLLCTQKKKKSTSRDSSTLGTLGRGESPRVRYQGRQPEKSLGHHGQTYVSSDTCCNLLSLLRTHLRSSQELAP